MFVYNMILIGFGISLAVSSAVSNLATISTCRLGEFTCLDGRCIRAGAVCDTYWDCPDGSDEVSCYSSTNSLYQCKCIDGTCTAVNGKCDGNIDCPDRSDETHARYKNINSPTVTGKCVLPPYPQHGTYVAINAPYATPGQSFEFALLNVTCEQGYGVVGDTLPHCLDGTWFTSIQKCVPFCRLYPDVSVHYYCQVPGTYGYRICNQFEPSGTLVKPECNTPIYDSKDFLLSMTCQSDGKWNRIIKCKPECGRVTPDAEGLIWGGTQAVRGELPWHVAVYRKPTQKKNYYNQICGGSLVSNSIVISAAHCFWDQVNYEKQAASNYAVATAKLFREWDHKDDKDAQKSELKSIELPPRFQGARASFQHDIAVLILETPFVYYNFVRPVCLDLFDPKFNYLQLQVGNFGKVTGWGLTAENGLPSPVLQVVQLPFVPILECIRITPEHFKEIITGDKICAGYNNGTAAICKGDSGSGLSFPETERGTTRYYLRGIVSSGPKVSQECNVFTVTTFTEIYQHRDFINKFIDQFHCKDGSTIPTSDLCDGNPNCPDGSDEEISACAAKTCPSYQFQCAYGACVDQGSDCNGINDCADGSDESDELCNRQVLYNPIVTNRLIQSGRCILPPYPEHGTYVVANAPYATPGQSLPSLILNVTCRQGYGVVGTDIVFCHDGVWSKSIPKCVRFCKIYNNPSVHFHCLDSGSNEGNRACNAYEPSGTIVMPECNSPYYHSAYTLPFMRCIDGSWDYVALCSPVLSRNGTNNGDAVFSNAELPMPVAEDTTVAPQTSTSTSTRTSTTSRPTTTTTRPTTTTTRHPPPKPESGCALAYDPYFSAGDPDVGYRFGTRYDSRIEYSKFPGPHQQGFNLTISFRTVDQHGGLVFYAAADNDPSQFLALFMKDAKLHFTFNCGGETALISSTQTYNDAEWHAVTLTRSAGHSKLAVDSELVGETSTICNASGVIAAPYFYGGLRNLNQYISKNLKGFYQPFKGCLMGLMMNGKPVTDVSYRVNSLRCTDNVEEGVYFGASNNSHSNYLKLLEPFKVGNEISISMEIRPRNSTGLLFSVHGKKDYLVLELLENEVIVSVENGRGVFRAIYELSNKITLCDGNWHKIHVVKSLYIVSVGVDGHFSKPGMGAYSSTDTCSALYIGGHVQPLNKLRGVRSRRGFTGCMKNILYAETPIKIPLTAAGRNTHVGVCTVD